MVDIKINTRHAANKKAYALNLLKSTIWYTHVNSLFKITLVQMSMILSIPIRITVVLPHCRLLSDCGTKRPISLRERSDIT